MAPKRLQSETRSHELAKAVKSTERPSATRSFLTIMEILRGRSLHESDLEPLP